jgi:hypothetical protein
MTFDTAQEVSNHQYGPPVDQLAALAAILPLTLATTQIRSNASSGPTAVLRLTNRRIGTFEGESFAWEKNSIAIVGCHLT